MAADIEKLAEQFKKQSPDIAFLLLSTAKVARSLGIPESFDHIEQEHQRQSLVLAERFASKLGMSEEEYISTMPPFPRRGGNYAERGLTVPLLVETRIPWMEAAKICGITVSSPFRYVSWERRDDMGENWQDNIFKMPDAPYSAWVQDGSKFISMSSSEVRSKLLEKDNKTYRPGRLLDAIAMLCVYPERCRGMHCNIVGSSIKERLYVPCVRPQYAVPGFDINHIDFKSSSYFPLVMAQEIGTLS